MDKLDDVLPHIFKFLPNDDIIVASEVCKRWHSIISSSEAIMQHLVLKIFDRTAGFEDEKSLTLPYRNIHIENYDASNSKKKFVKKCLTNRIETMILFDPNDFFVDFLPLMTNLTELSLWKYNTRNGDIKVDFPNLKSLVLLDASSYIYHIRNHKIETLKVREDEDNVYENVSWGKFFGTCEMLKNLSLENTECDFDLCDYGFKLSSLVILGRFHNVFLKNVFALIRAQKDSLKKISLDVDMPEDPDILNFMINDMKLEELNWNYNNNHCMNYVEPKQNSTLKKLKLTFNYGVAEYLLYVLKSLQAVEDFDVDFWYAPQCCKKILPWLHDHMPEMKTLTIRNPVHIEESELKANQVETLIIHRFPSGVDQRKRILTCAPNIKKLIIKGEIYNLPPEEFKTVPKSLTRLEEFIFHGKIEVDDEVLELISHSKLRRITIVYYSSQLVSDIEVCEKLKAANAQLVFMKRFLMSKIWHDEADLDITSLFWSHREY